MQLQRLAWAASLAALVAVAAVMLLMQPVQSAPAEVAKSEAEAAAAKVPTMFDFDQYKQLYKKSYTSLVENMVRFKLFTARALRAIISAVKFRFGHKRYHLSVNHMSDITPAELDAMRNKVMDEANHVPAPVQDEELEFVPAAADDEDAISTAKRLIEEHAGEPDFEALREQLGEVEEAHAQHVAQRRRRKRETGSEQSLKPVRELPVDKLFSKPAPDNPDAELPAETRAKIVARPASNNPNYTLGQIEPMTQGLVDQQRPLPDLDVVGRRRSSLASDLSKSLADLRAKYLSLSSYGVGVSAPEEPVKLPDEVFLDLRKSSNCLFAPRNQGTCGSCYAFAATAVAEWVHCAVTGELVAFSEQYMVDCGPHYGKPKDLNGCDGGFINHVGPYFQNFGFELRSSYPYVARQQQCPYSLDTDLTTTGYLRADLKRNIAFHARAWPEALQMHGPMVINIDGEGAIHEYGGGVFDECRPNIGNHAVVVIGHGREDGEEYWLIRNSWSAGWGEGGHLKLAKKADCVSPDWGWTFGSEDGEQLSLRPEKNFANDNSIIVNKQKEALIRTLG